MSYRPWGLVVLCTSLFTWGCGGCGDDAAVEPDAEIVVDPDAEVPDAEPTAVDPVTAFDVEPGATAGTVDATWTSPAGAAEVIVVRHLGAAVASAPADGTTYALDDTTGTGDVVVYAGTGTSFTDTGVPPGFIHYAAFARNTVDDWATPAATDSAFLAAVAQTATITVTVSTTTAVVTNQPADYTLAATATYDGTLDELTVHVDATSGFARNVFAPKAEVTAVNQGAITGDGDLDTFPYVRLGAAIAPAGTGGADLLFAGVDGTVDTITIDLTIVDNPIGVAFTSWSNNPTGDQPFAYELIDTATMSSLDTVPVDEVRFSGPVGANGNDRGVYKPGPINPEGTRLYAGSRMLPIVREIDLATHAVLRTVTLETGIGAVFWVVSSPDGGTLYAALHIGGHAYKSQDVNGAQTALQDLVVVKLDAATLTETGRVTIIDDEDDLYSRVKHLAISPTGDRLAVPVNDDDTAMVHIVNTSTMTVAQSVDLSTVLTGFKAKQAAIDSTGSFAYVNGYGMTSLAKVDLGTFAVTGVALEGFATSYAGEVVAGADGVIYVSSYADSAALAPHGLARVDGTTVTYVDDDAYGPMALLGDRLIIADDSTNSVRVYDAATLAEDPDDGGPTVLTLTHGMSLTPF